MTVASAQTGIAPAPEHITPRNVDFGLDKARAANWLDGSPEKTLFLNALSILFPPGERFFINAVLSRRDRITDPKLKAEVKAFVQQEAYHTREHVAYNEALNTLVDADKLDRELSEYLDWVKKTLPEGGTLLATCALEHFTAIMAHALLSNDADLRGADADYARMWTWHALEECEHKAVAFDVYLATMGRKYEFRRMVVMALTTTTFLKYIGKHCIALMRAQKLAKKPSSWAKLLWFVFADPGILRRIVPAYLQYYRPGFHPNDIDDRAELAATRELVAAW